MHRFEEIRRGDRRLRLHGEPLLGVEDRRRGVHLLVRPLLRAAYLVFRFSNVYGRYDNDLHRMVRVIPLFIHAMLRGEPITVYGGRDKTLDFTYVDDCVDGIVRGIEALAERPGRERDDQPRVRRRATRSSAPRS